VSGAVSPSRHAPTSRVRSPPTPASHGDAGRLESDPEVVIAGSPRARRIPITEASTPNRTGVVCIRDGTFVRPAAQL
jgi:hypothetical protein